MSAVGQALGQVLRALQIRSSQSLQGILLMRDTGKYFTMIEVLFLKYMHVYFVPNIGILEVSGVRNNFACVGTPPSAG